MTRLAAAAATDVGLVRTINQDRWLVAEPLFAVADGMGGHAAGEVASKTALDALRATFTAGPSTVAGVSAAVQAANEAVWQASRGHPELRGMGTTLTAVALVGEPGAPVVAVANVGDSRTYRLRIGRLEQLTVDHTYVAELVADGEIDADEAELHPQRHVLTRAVGVSEAVDADVDVSEPELGDRYLLCSDGLCRELTDEQIATVLRRLGDPGEAARELVELAKLHGGSDNITVVVVDVVPDRDPGGLAPPPPPESEAESHGDGPTRPLWASDLAGSSDQPDPASAEAASEDQTSSVLVVDQPARGAQAAGKGPGRPYRPAHLQSVTLSPAERRALRKQAAAEARDRARKRRAELKANRVPRARLVTFRVVLFCLLLLAVVAAAAYGTKRYARYGYFVGLQGQQLTIFHGRPGGFLWWNPTVAQHTSVTTADVESRHKAALQAGVVEPSMTAARQWIFGLVQEKELATKYAPPKTTTPKTTTPKTTTPKTTTPKATTPKATTPVTRP